MNNNIKKVTLSNNVKIIDTDNGTYVYKKSNYIEKQQELFKYLKSKNFNNYLDYLYNQDNFVVYPYIDGLVKSEDEKANDLIELIALLHSKTEFYKSYPLDDIKKFYEEKTKYISYLDKYYDDKRVLFEEEEYPSPSHYYFLNNCSWIFHSLNSSKYFLDDWYTKIKEVKTKRECLIHNNLELDHLLESENKYLISWDKSKNDSPIYDLIGFYKKNYNNISFYELLETYENIFPLVPEEKSLLFSLMLLPEKIDSSDIEIINTKNIFNVILYLKESNRIISKYHPSNTNSQNNKQNK